MKKTASAKRNKQTAVHALDTATHECEVLDVVLRTVTEDRTAVVEGAVLLGCAAKGKVWCRFKVLRCVPSGRTTELSANGVAVWSSDDLPTWLIKPVADWLGSSER